MRSPLIIGGGPAGAAAAALIAAAGYPVTLLERSIGPTDKVCGDFLSGEAVTALRALGFDPLTVEATPIRIIRLVNRHAVAEVALPFPAMGLTRRTLDEALLQLAARRGATVCRGQTARSMQRSPAGLVVRTDHRSVNVAGPVFLATGKHDLRGAARPARRDGLIGLKMYYTLAPDQQAALHESVELLLFAGGYAGLQIVERHRTVLCMLVSAARWRDAGGWHALLDQLTAEAPWLGRRLAGAIPCLPRPLAIAGMPYGHLHDPGRQDPTDLFRLGDQTCVIPSLVGDGIAIALHSAMAAADTWLTGGDAHTYHRRLNRAVRRPLRLASLIHLGCRSSTAQPMIVAACRQWPGVMRLAASATRVPAVA